MLIASRAVMGIGGAFIMPSTLSILTNVFPAEERGRAIGIWAAVSGLGIAIGPVTGGWLIQHYSWNAVFLVNLPFVLLAVAAGTRLVPESKDPHATPLDPVGAVISIAGLTALLWAIIEAPTCGWTDARIIAAFGVAVVVLSAFIAWELRVEHPMLDIRLFRNPRFSAASASVSLVFFALMGVIFFLTQYLQSVLGYDPLQAGVRVMPVAAGLMVAAPLSARLAERVGTKVMVAGGLGVVGLGLLLMSTVSVGSGYGRVGLAMLVLGFGMGSAMAPATDSIMGSLPLAHAGVGSAVNDTTRQVGGALGVAVLGSLLTSGYGAHMDGHLSRLPDHAASLAHDQVAGAAAVADRIGGQAGAALNAAAHSAFISAMDTTVLVAAAVAFTGALLAALFLPARESKSAEPEWSGAPATHVA